MLPDSILHGTATCRYSFPLAQGGIFPGRIVIRGVQEILHSSAALKQKIQGATDYEVHRTKEHLHGDIMKLIDKHYTTDREYLLLNTVTDGRDRFGRIAQAVPAEGWDLPSNEEIFTVDRGLDMRNQWSDMTQRPDTDSVAIGHWDHQEHVGLFKNGHIAHVQRKTQEKAEKAQRVIETKTDSPLTSNPAVVGGFAADMHPYNDQVPPHAYAAASAHHRSQYSEALPACDSQSASHASCNNSQIPRSAPTTTTDTTATSQKWGASKPDIIIWTGPSKAMQTRLFIELKYEAVRSGAGDYMSRVSKARRHGAYQLMWYLFLANVKHDVHLGIAVAQDRFIRVCNLGNGRFAVEGEPSVGAPTAMTVAELDREPSWVSATWGHPILDDSDYTFITSIQSILWTTTEQALRGRSGCADDPMLVDTWQTAAQEIPFTAGEVTNAYRRKKKMNASPGGSVTQADNSSGLDGSGRVFDSRPRGGAGGHGGVGPGVGGTGDGHGDHGGGEGGSDDGYGGLGAGGRTGGGYRCQESGGTESGGGYGKHEGEEGGISGDGGAGRAQEYAGTEWTHQPARKGLPGSRAGSSSGQEGCHHINRSPNGSENAIAVSDRGCIGTAGSSWPSGGETYDFDVQAEPDFCGANVSLERTYARETPGSLYGSDHRVSLVAGAVPDGHIGRVASTAGGVTVDDPASEPHDDDNIRKPELSKADLNTRGATEYIPCDEVMDNVDLDIEELEQGKGASGRLLAYNGIRVEFYSSSQMDALWAALAALPFTAGETHTTTNPIMADNLLATPYNSSEKGAKHPAKSDHSNHSAGPCIAGEAGESFL